eukprot:8484911-Alexandrium_andersonii.AAC.1
MLLMSGRTVGSKDRDKLLKQGPPDPRAKEYQFVFFVCACTCCTARRQTSLRIWSSAWHGRMKASA